MISSIQLPLAKIQGQLASTSEMTLMCPLRWDLRHQEVLLHRLCWQAQLTALLLEQTARAEQVCCTEKQGGNHGSMQLFIVVFLRSLTVVDRARKGIQAESTSVKLSKVPSAQTSTGASSSPSAAIWVHCTSPTSDMGRYDRQLKSLTSS